MDQQFTANKGTPGDERHPADFVIVGRVVTMDRQLTVFGDGAVAVKGSDIVGVGKRADVLSHFRPARQLGGRRAIVLPGLIDAHTHCTQCFVRTLTAGELPMIPRIYNPATRSLTPEHAHATVRLISAQLLRAGVTTLCEGSLNPAHDDAIVDALEGVGIRCCFARGAADQEFHHAALYAQISERSWAKARAGEAERDLELTQACLERFPSRGKGLIRGAVNASALLGFSETYLREGAALARHYDTTLQVHVARDREEVEFCLDMWGRRPVERLDDLGVINEHLLAIHAVLASEGEIAMLGAAGAGLAHSPIECVNNLNAVPNIQRFRHAGVRVALGCDNQCNDMFATIRAAWLVHSALWGIPNYNPEYLTAEELLSMATRESAKVLRWDDRIGSLEVGKAADIVVLNGDVPHLMALHNLPADVVRWASRAEVRHTMVDGRLLYDEGRFPTIDIERLWTDSAAGASHVRGIITGRRYRHLDIHDCNEDR